MDLVRMQPFPTYYEGSTTNPAEYRNGGVWKIDQPTKAPRLAIHRNVIRIDKDSHTWVPLMPIKEMVTSCSDNVILWLGSGPFPEDVTPLSYCFTVTTDASVWNTAVAKMEDASPGVRARRCCLSD